MKQIKISKNFESPEIKNMYQQARYFQPYAFFFNVYGRIPNKMIFDNINRKLLYNKIMAEFNPEPCDFIKSEEWNLAADSYKFNTVYFTVGKGICIYFNPQNGDHGVEILYLPETENKLLDEIKETVLFCRIKIDENSIYIMRKLSDEISLESFPIKKNNIDPENLFNDDFIPGNEVIIRKLNEDNGKGLVLLHGKPGTGKTTYIRYLIGKVKKRLIFIPPDVVPALSEPGFISLLMCYPNSVLIIEDAENAIEERKSGGNSAVSNLLNLTDGLLSDCVHIQAVCTFNTDFSRIDKALSRKGRLIARYHFVELKKEKAQILSDANGFSNKIEKNMTLADIFNQDEMDFTTQSNKIGFLPKSES